MIKKLCLAGASSKGFCYVGALAHMDEEGLLDNIEEFGGVSIGALTAVCHTIGYSSSEMFDILLDKNVNDFQDISIEHVLHQGSVMKGDKYKTWIWEVLSKKIDPMLTFNDIYEKFGVKLLMTTTCLEDGLVILSYNETPDMPIFYAVMATMALPFIFPPVRYNHKTYIDGGVLDNFPTRLMGDDVIGIWVRGRDIEHDRSNIINYIASLFQLISRRMRELHGDKGEIIMIDGGDFNFIDFNFGIDEKLTLYYRGYERVEDLVIRKSVDMVMESILQTIENTQ